ncbi:MAG: YihY/virulence factor BrkB family protein [Eubacteriaceae bacterium]|nr:YihY/virulence factor BrkB family protein [Eubacteriaceae bacterium]
MTSIKRFSRFLITQGEKNNIINLSAQMSYRALLAFIPFLMLLYNFINWASSELNGTLINGLSQVLPAAIMNDIDTAMDNAVNNPISLEANLVFSFFILYVSISAMYSLIISLNRIFGQKETRGMIALWFQSVLYLFLFLIIILLTIICYLLGAEIFDQFFAFLNLSHIFAIFLSIFSAIYLVIISALIFTLIYMFAPKNHLSFFEAFPGGIFVSVGWLLVFFIYNILTNPVMNLTTFFNNIQGPLSLCIVIFMICFTLTLGGVINLYALDNKAIKKGNQ